MPIETEKGIVFVHIPKNGGTSVVKALKDNFNYQWELTGKLKEGYEYKDNDLIRNLSFFDPQYAPRQTRQMQHLVLYDMLPFLKRHQRKWEIFAVTRNPFDRLVSMYEYGKQTGGRMETSGKTFKEWVKSRNIIKNLQSPYIATNLENVITGKVSLGEYCKTLTIDDSSIHLYDISMLKHCIRDMIVAGGDETGNIDEIIPHEKKTKRRNYREYYDEDTRRHVEEESAVDLVNFKHSF